MARPYSADYRRRAVDYYRSHRASMSLAAVAKHFGIKGGKTTVFRWVKQGGNQETRARSGRPRILNSGERKRYVLHKVQYRNQRHEGIKYNEIVDTIRAQTGKSISKRTVRRYGQEEGIKQKRTIRRTQVECNKSQTRYII